MRKMLCAQSAETQAHVYDEIMVYLITSALYTPTFILLYCTQLSKHLQHLIEVRAFRGILCPAFRKQRRQHLILVGRQEAGRKSTVRHLRPQLTVDYAKEHA